MYKKTTDMGIDTGVMRVALTGGIGSGKSYVGWLLRAKGIDVYDCDAAAKRLMATSETLQLQLRQLIGEDVVEQGVLRKDVIAAFLLSGDTNRQRLNDVVHPAVAEDFMVSGLNWMESAIFFDSGFDRRVHIDRVVGVSSPLDVRVRRIMRRDGVTAEVATRWIDAQMAQEELEARCDYVLHNDDDTDMEASVDDMLRALQGSVVRSGTDRM